MGVLKLVFDKVELLGISILGIGGSICALADVEIRSKKKLVIKRKFYL